MLERIVESSLCHRFLVLLLTIGVAVLGGVSLAKLPIDAVPDITNNQVQINTAYAAFSPLEIEKQVTFPVETALAGIPGMEYSRSLSRNGFSQVTAVFVDSVDIYFARQQVAERLLEAREDLPPGAEPRMGPVSTGLGEVFMWVVEYEHPDGDVESENPLSGWQRDGAYLTPEGRRLSNSLEKAAYLREIQDWVIRPQLRSVPGVAGVDAIGGYVRQFTVEPDPLKLVSHRVSFAGILEALERNSQSSGAGYIEDRGESYVVRASGPLRDEDAIGDIVIGERNGTPIRVRDIANVQIGKELRTGSASENGHEVVVGTALMLIGENSRAVARRVEEKIAEINENLPPDIRAKPVLNRTKLVNATIDTVRKNLFEGAILVIVVLFLLLGNLRAAFITALAIPLSMLMTATGMVRGKVSGNLMSLGAIDFGLIVDGAVIIVDNCIRHLAERQHREGRVLTTEERLHTVRVATREMIQPSVFGQAIIITVYVPILFLSGIEGKMFQPMAFTVIIALVSAFVLSLTFIPAMIALLLRGRMSERENLFIVAAKRIYAPTLHVVLRLRYVVVGAAAAIFALSLFVLSRLGQEFVPTLDEKDIAMHAMRIPSTSLSQSQEMQFAVERAVRAIPEVQTVFSKTGTAEVASDPMPVNVSDTFIILKATDEWSSDSRSKADVIRRIQNAVSQVPGNNYEFTQPIQMRFNELIAGVRSDVAIKIFGDDFDSLLSTAQQAARTLSQVKGAADIKVEQVTGLPMLDIKINRAVASRLGLDVADVQDVISTAIGGREGGVVFEGDRRFDIVVRLPEVLRSDLDALRRLPVPLPEHRESKEESKLIELSISPGFVPLSAIADLAIQEGPNQISRENGKRRIVVQANVRGRDLGSFVTDAQAAFAENVKVPSGYWVTWGGQFENLVAAKERLGMVVPLCFSVIFLLLFGTFNSVRQALMVFSGVPLALTGGIIALWVRGMPFSISAAVGFIALSGVAVLNGLVMVSFINQLRREGRTLDEAIVEGALTRLRPVMMTALVASLGFVPMALATGTGAEVQKPLATVVIGGLISATLLTLLVLPALYSMFHRSSETDCEEQAGAARAV